MAKKLHLVITSISFLDWWNSLSIKAQRKYLKEHDRSDSNYKIAVANQKKGKAK